MAFLGCTAASALAALDRHRDCPAGVCTPPMGAEYAGQKLERHAAHDLGAGIDHQRTLSIHQASNLYSLPAHPGINTFIAANWLIGFAWLGMILVELASRVRFEESLLLEYFGDQYREYMKRTGRLLPKLIQ